MITNRSIRFLFILGAFVALSGCYTTSVLTHEIKCGLGRDYICTPQPATDNNNNPTVQILCGCMDKEDLRPN